LKKTNIEKIIEKGLTEGVKSIFLLPGFPPMGNKRELVRLGDTILSSNYIDSLLSGSISEWQYNNFKEQKELDYSYAFKSLGRFRVNAFFKMGQIGLVIRPIPDKIPSFDSLNLPAILKDFTKYNDGLVLITGVTGSGKSTTLAAMVDSINREKACHIVTIEDPIEFVYKTDKSIISQKAVKGRPGCDSRR
jgi:twitching motility protein PilT